MQLTCKRLFSCPFFHVNDNYCSGRAIIVISFIFQQRYNDFCSFFSLLLHLRQDLWSFLMRAQLPPFYALLTTYWPGLSLLMSRKHRKRFKETVDFMRKKTWTLYSIQNNCVNKSFCSPLPLACIDGKRWNGSAPQCELVTTPVPGAIITFLFVHSLSCLPIFQLSTGETCSSLRSPPPPQSSPQSSSLPSSSPWQAVCETLKTLENLKALSSSLWVPNRPRCWTTRFLSTLTAVEKYVEWQKTTVVKVNVEKLLSKRKWFWKRKYFDPSCVISYMKGRDICKGSHRLKNLKGHTHPCSEVQNPNHRKTQIFPRRIDIFGWYLNCKTFIGCDL